MSERADVCIVGSGFGGSILAYYLASAGQKVVVLERGPRRRTASLQVDMRARDLLDITHTFSGNGGSAVGGGSPVYSGVGLRAPSFVFERQEAGRRVWPAGLSRRTMDRWYRRAETGLGVHQLGFDEVAKRGGSWGLRMNRPRLPRGFDSPCHHGVPALRLLQHRLPLPPQEPPHPELPARRRARRRGGAPRARGRVRRAGGRRLARGPRAARPLEPDEPQRARADGRGRGQARGPRRRSDRNGGSATAVARLPARALGPRGAPSFRQRRPRADGGPPA